ncbi:ead/Ea22-like family protein [Pseudomonas sp. GL-R-26]|uniref:ead/Ea22-like family protein n=1 Tax=Pseudomonas sp. GL-R-26 TaxID=2832392 RepID=UPI001CC12E00|nr:ead/Ea22-like family protein [Pseudomonas sp. GL-R-26]
MSDHRELKKLAKGATPGPWTYDNRDGHGIFGPAHRSGSAKFSDRVMKIHTARQPDLLFVAAANPRAVFGLIVECELQVEKLAELALERDQLKIDNTALVKSLEHQCNWLQSLIDIGGKADADTMGAMLAKLRHELAMNKVYARG